MTLSAKNRNQEQPNLESSKWREGTPLVKLGLSRRTYNALLRGGIRTVELLVAATDWELLLIRGIGSTSLTEIDALLKTFLARKSEEDSGPRTFAEEQRSSKSQSAFNLQLGSASSPQIDPHVQQNTSSGQQCREPTNPRGLGAHPSDQPFKSPGSYSSGKVEDKSASSDSKPYLVVRRYRQQTTEIPEPPPSKRKDQSSIIRVPGTNDDWANKFRTLTEDKNPIALLRLSELLQYRLSLAGFTSIGDLADSTAEQLLSLPGMGGVKVGQIQTALISYMLDRPQPVTVTEQPIIERRLSNLVSPETIGQLLTAPLDRISISRLGLAESVNSQLRDVDVHTIDSLIELSSYLSKQDEVFQQLQSYLEWLARQRAPTWASEVSETGPSPLHHHAPVKPLAEEPATDLVTILTLTLRARGRSTHFTDITSKVNEQLPHDKQATTHDVMVHLINHADVFVRVEPGVYDLVERDLQPKHNPSSSSSSHRPSEIRDSQPPQVSSAIPSPQRSRPQVRKQNTSRPASAPTKNRLAASTSWHKAFQSLASDRNPIAVLMLSQRLEDKLARVGFTFVGELANVTREQLLDLPGLDEVKVNHIQASMTTYMRQRPNEHAVAADHDQAGSLRTLVAPSLAEHLSTAPLDSIPISRLGLNDSANTRLRDIGLGSIGMLVTSSNYLSKRDEVLQPLKVYLTWLAEQDAAIWSDEAANIGASPVLELLLRELPAEGIVDSWLATSLYDRERDVIVLRYGLHGSRLSLEEIGQTKGVTRERVRQIEKKALRKLAAYHQSLTEAFQTSFRAFIIEQGGLTTRSEAAAWFAAQTSDSTAMDPAGVVILLCAVSKNCTYLRTPKLIMASEIPAAWLTGIQTAITKCLDDQMAPTAESVLLAKFQQTAGYQAAVVQWTDDAPVSADQFIRACLRTHPDIEEREPGIVALRKWATRIGDNIIVALRELGEPTHFTAIAEAVNRQLSDDREATAHNVHAHMLRYEDIFVRVGHGIYGLAEWQDGRDRSVADTAARTLKAAGHPLHVSRLNDEVLKVWQVGTATVYMALQNESYYRPDSPDANRCMLLGDGVFSLTDWEAARAAEAEPILPYCPPGLPDPPDFENALFESVIVAHEQLQDTPRVDKFLAGMWQWAKTSSNQNRWLQQGVLNAYYLVGLIPYTFIFTGDNPRLRSTLPDGDIATLRRACLAALTRRLAFMPEFWGVLSTMTPSRAKELGEAYVALRPDGLDDTAPRLALLAGLGAVTRGPDWQYRLTALGVACAREWGQKTSLTEETPVKARTVEAPIPQRQGLNNCPALLPDQIGRKYTFLDSIILADKILSSKPTTENFLVRIVDTTGRSGPKSAGYYQNVLDSFYVVGLIDHTSYANKRTSPLESRLPDTFDVSEIRHYCITSALSNLRFAPLFLNTANRIQPFSQADMESSLGMTFDNAKRHIRLFVNLGVLMKKDDGYALTALGEEYLSEEQETYAIDIAYQPLLEEDEPYIYAYEDDLEALGYLDWGGE